MKQLRIQKGYTQKQLANTLEVSQQYISKLENGDVGGLTINKLVHISKVLETTPEVLLNRLLSKSNIK